MKLTLQYLTAAILLAGAARQLVQLARHRHDLALRVLAPGLICVSVAATVGINGSLAQVVGQQLLGPYYPGFVNALWITMAYCFATFFVLASDAGQVQDRIRTARRGLIVAVVVITVVVLLPVVDRQGFHRADGYDYRSWQRILYSVLVEGVALVFFVVGLVRARRYLRKVTHVWLSWALRLVWIGAFGMALVDVAALLTLVLRVIEDANHPKHYPALSAIYITGLLGGQTALTLGLVLPAIGAAASMIIRRRERIVAANRDTQIEPLWRTLTDAFPYVVLPEYSGTASATSAIGHFDRRTTEITDALAQLAPFYTAAGLTADDASTGIHDPAEAARIISAALRLRAGEHPRADPPYPRIEPDHRGWQERARWMARTARELDRVGSQPERPLVV